MKKALSIVLALLMLLAMIPASLAQETAPGRLCYHCRSGSQAGAAPHRPARYR